MRLTSFNGYGIRGYQEQHIQFRNSMTFLIGINGSGKTTVLNLIQGLLRPSYHILNSIEFDTIQVSFVLEGDRDPISVTCEKTKDNLHLILNLGDSINQMDFPRSEYQNIEYDDDRGEKYMQISESFSNHPLCRDIATYKAPMFLTLDRLPQNIDRNFLVHRMRARRSMIGKGTIDTCLMAIQEAIFNQYRLNASKQNNYIVNLRNTIVKKSLSFMTDDHLKTYDFQSIVDGMSTIEKREKEFMEVLVGLDIPGIQEIATEFFTRLKEASFIIMGNGKKEYSENERNQAKMRLVFSQSQLQRVEEISKLGHEYQDKVAKLQEPMNRFTDCVNMFFKECGKKFVLDHAGNMKVIHPRGTSSRSPFNEVTELSSGEKQIVAMLGSLIFLREESDPDIYFIDEPEISLHLSWQDIFVDALLKACPKYQFVLATHSPNIISRQERRSWCENLSPKFLKNGAR